ncbi:MAG: hypothetical protein KJ795_07325 [Gammaproteobacteria bacterium]|nr:hypothetical protein [Gammaproteobacteria bacterium]MBU1777640.1 hypothetical protein [Gammaproteobacteria bacterium]MBU1969796.1 hypothetical protein [Gammaproteobacteria bacterium]
MRYLFAILAALALTACADPARNLYDGIKANNDAKRSPNERAMTPAPTYDQYKKEIEK